MNKDVASNISAENGAETRKLFVFIHGYLPKVWEAQVQAGIVGENDGVRFCQNLLLKDSMKFNELAAIGSELYNIIADRKCVFYIDRLQGGCYIEEYPYDEKLLDEYKRILGDKFWGFQMHEWMSNYRSDAFKKLGDLPSEQWTEEGIKDYIYKKYPYPCLFLEAMTAKEMADGGKPETLQIFYKNITDIYRNRLERGDLIPCDSGYLAYAFEISCGTKKLMPEVGAQTKDARVQICYARGMTRAEGRSFGVYYEPWGGSPFSACCYHRENKNEWGIGESKNFPFETQGPNGGSSRSLQKRVFLYGYLSGAEFMSEEWGLCNAFYDWDQFELSPYGQAKKDFLDFTRKYTDIGDKVTPIAMVLPKDLMVLDNLYSDDVYCGFNVESKELAKVKQGIREIFASSLPMIGTETTTLKNSDIPDAIDLLNDGESVLDKYDYLIDLTCSPDFTKKHNNLCAIEDVKSVLKEKLPCFVEGNAHWLVNKKLTGGHYLTVFNHSGIQRTVAEGEVKLLEADTKVVLSVADGVVPKLCEGVGVLYWLEGNKYSITIPAGGWVFIDVSKNIFRK